MADQISDAILDACLEQDPFSKVACECALTVGMVMVFGEISSNASIDFQSIIRNKIAEIGYDESAKGFDYKTCAISLMIQKQSPEIADSLVQHGQNLEDIGAGDQGIMFGYATDETEEMIPLSLLLSHKLAARLAVVRRSGELPWLRPDCKTQVTIEYRVEGGATIPLRVHTVVVSAQHADGVAIEAIRAGILEKVIRQTIPARYLDARTVYHIQPSGHFVIGGPMSDAGLTGRKIIVDTYGGWASHGGGAFSGKDWSKVDRSGAYVARWIAKSLVSAGLCRRCLIQLSYVIGYADPLSIFIETYGTGTRTDAELISIVRANFDLRPGMVVKELDLFRPIYRHTACYGHFGRPEFTWEVPKALLHK